jgi:hypothetical protein
VVNEAIKERTLGWLVDSNCAQRLNIVFDVDNTLVFAHSYSRAEPFDTNKTQDATMMVLSDGHPFVLVIR